MGIFDRAKDALSGHSEQVAAAIDKAGDFVDEKTGLAVRITDHPNLRISDRPGSGPDALKEAWNPTSTGWKPNDSHQPSLNYLPYLLTGDQYRLDEIHAQLSWNIAGLASLSWR